MYQQCPVSVSIDYLLKLVVMELSAETENGTAQYFRYGNVPSQCEL